MHHAAGGGQDKADGWGTYIRVKVPGSHNVVARMPEIIPASGLWGLSHVKSAPNNNMHGGAP